uniref:Protamine-2 n=1 Tax=Rousettus aegyptiacus TaxID=9407 RepID=A0A7J8F401_ROUAE|nr:protamine 2 [Rousettus aegyptiacus]
MVRHRTRSPSETPQQGGQEQEQEPNTEDIQVDGRTLRGRYHYRRRHCSCRRRRRRACRHRRHRRGCRRSRRRRRCRRRH